MAFPLLCYNALMQTSSLATAKELGVHPSTISGLCNRGVIHCIKKLNQNYRYAWFLDRDELTSYLERRRQSWLNHKIECRDLAEVDKAYLAGLLDGEGCLTAFISKVGGTRWWNTRYFIQVIMSDKNPIQWIKETTRIGYLFKRPRQNKGWQDLWGWRADNHVACAVIRQIMPYLKVKHRHAEIFLKLEKRILEAKAYRGGGSNKASMPKEEYIERQNLIDEIHRLNKRKGKVIRKEFSDQTA